MPSGKHEKIAIVIYSLKRDGAEKVVAVLSQQFARLGHQVTVIAFDGRDIGYEIGGELIDLALPSHPKPGFLRKALTLVMRAWRLRHVYRQSQFDRIIAVMESAAFPSILTGYNTIVSNHCNPDIYFTRYEWLLARILYPRAKNVVMVSKQGEQSLQQRLNLHNLHCIYNPVDFSELGRLATKEPAISMDGEYIIAVARLEKQKRLDRLITAFAESDLKQTLKLLVLGEGSLRQALQQQIKALQLTDRVILAGNVANPFPNIRAARFLVLSSDHEGFPMVLIEALALGKPVISTDCETGPAEIINSGQNGFLVPLHDTAGLAKAMDVLNQNESLYQQFCTQASASVSHLSAGKISRQWLAL